MQQMSKHSSVKSTGRVPNQQISMLLSRCCIATASPAKFLEVVQKAGLTESIDVPEAVRQLETKETRYKHLERNENWERALRERIEAIGSARQQGAQFYT